MLCASSLVALLSFWNRNDLPPGSAILPALAEEPRQEPTTKEPFAVEYSGVRYEVEPQFEYELNGMVVSYRQHDGSSRMHRAANDHLNVADLCVVWGDTATSPHLSEIEFWNGDFTCNFETSDSAAWESIRPEQISNNHLISDDDAIRDRVADVRIGDQVRVRGWLATYGSGANRRGTSTQARRRGQRRLRNDLRQRLRRDRAHSRTLACGAICVARCACARAVRALSTALSAVRRVSCGQTARWEQRSAPDSPSPASMRVGRA